MVRTARLPRALLALAACALSTAAAPAAAAPSAPTPGSPGLGDRQFPLLGNGGYDVRHYVLDLRYATASPAEPIHGTVTIVARATQDLSRFDLDWAGRGLAAVTVDGRPAAWSRAGDELVVTPRHPLTQGHGFKVRVHDFEATSIPLDPEIGTTAILQGQSGTAWALQPNVAHFVFPSNDHPRDKATFAFRLDVPAGATAVANGVLTGRRTAGDRTVWRYLMRRPMATELAQVAVGNALDLTSRGISGGVRFRDVTPRPLTAALLPLLGTERDHLNFIRRQVGPYPFDTYGSLVLDGTFGFALETQTVSLYPAFAFRLLPQGRWEPIMVHELAHMWFGDAVSPADWSDLWLNEGHATWYEVMWAAEHGQLPDDKDFATLEDYFHATYARGDNDRARFGPVAVPRAATLFSNQAYDGGALVLYALRQRVGAGAFERVERAWVRLNLYRSATTDDFIALASEVTGENLQGFLRDWLYGATTPPMPGHPDWAQGDFVPGPDRVAEASEDALARR